MTYTWAPVMGATGYNVEIQYQLGNVWNDWDSTNVTGTTYTSDFGTDGDGRWRVTAVDNTHAMLDSAPGQWWGFSYHTLSVPTVVGPTGGQTLYLEPPYTVTFSWNSVAGATGYFVIIQYSLDNVNWYNWASTACPGSSSYSTDYNWAQYSRWCVAANDSAHPYADTAFSDWNYFFVQEKYLPPPVLKTPADGATFSNYPRWITFTWDAVPGAKEYLINIRYWDPLSMTWESWVSTTVTDTTYTTEFVGAQPGRWNVATISGDGSSSQPSMPRGFTFTV